MNKKLYFFAILPPEPYLADMQQLTEEISKKYNTRKALNSPPHITLIPPFWYFDEYLDDLLDIQSNINENMDSIPIEVEGFSTFPRKVLFLSVRRIQSLKDLVSQIYDLLPEIVKSDIKLYPEFHPHITVAFKDISWPNFKKAKKEYLQKSYHIKFESASISLLQHNKGKWKVIK